MCIITYIPLALLSISAQCLYRSNVPVNNVRSCTVPAAWNIDLSARKHQHSYSERLGLRRILRQLRFYLHRFLFWF